MLRNERAGRRITHPHLAYSTTGSLICQLCNIQIKTEALWNKHLNSTLHAKNAQTPRALSSSEESSRVNNSKKRKADDESSDEDTRKRTKGGEERFSKGPSLQTVEKTETPVDEFIAPMVNEASENPPAPPADPDHPIIDVPSDSHPVKATSTVDENEWAAFQRDIATPPPEPTALTAAADIVSAPLTAAELAVQSREQASRQAKERLEAEVEGEKEDAARQLEEEFEEMAELEDRVRKLREKREQLRMKEKQEGEVVMEDEKLPWERIEENGYESEEGSGDDEDGWGEWGR